MQSTLRHPRRSLLVLLAFLLLLTTAQLGPFRTAASAWVEHKCQPEWATMKQVTGTGLDIIWRCEPSWRLGSNTIWNWVLYRFEPGSVADDKKTVTWVYDNTPPTLYRMGLNAMVGRGRGGGGAAGSVVITTLDGGNLDRRIASRVIMQVSTAQGWATCNDSGWREGPGARSWWTSFINQGTEPDCGNASYRAQVWGRFFSGLTNSWITRGPIYSPSVSISGPCCASPTEPTISPGPPVTDPNAL
jgi:hypothetical protein